MQKAVRVVLYSISILLVVLVCFAFVRGAKQKRMETINVAVVEETEDTEKIAEQEAASTDTESTLAEDTEEVAWDSNGDGTSLVFTGDILLGNSIGGKYESDGINGILSEDLLQDLKTADITMVNEEFPFSLRGTQMQDKQYTFHINPAYVTAFQDMGVDIVSLANNHTLDYGAEALQDTFQTLDDAGILYAGAGDSKERAMELQTIEKNGKVFGFLAASRVIPVESWNVESSTPGLFATYDATALLNEIEKAKETCDYLTVYVHWGVEHNELPEDYQRTLAKQYIQSGADLVIGSHTHCLQGVEFFDGKPVFYSLGNFLFGQGGQTAAVKVNVDNSGYADYYLIPANETGAKTSKLTGEDGKKVLSYMESISFDTKIAEDGAVTPAAGN